MSSHTPPDHIAAADAPTRADNAGANDLGQLAVIVLAVEANRL